MLDAGEGLRSGEQEASLDRLELENDNIRAALEWSLGLGDPEDVAAAGWSLFPYWWLRGSLDEGSRWMTEAIDSGRLSEQKRAEALLVKGFVGFWRADYKTAMPALTEALGSFTSSGDERPCRLGAPAARCGAGSVVATRR